MDSGLCLTSKPGVTATSASEYHQRHGQAVYTGNPAVEAPAANGDARQRWYTDGTLVINTVKEDLRGSFALMSRPDPLSGMGDSTSSGNLEMIGSGSTLAGQWQTADGYIYENGDPDNVIT